jgi:hypothetical protein
LSSALIRPLAALVAISFLAVACGGSSGTEGATEGELLDFSLVQENDFAFEADPADPNRGVFRVITTEPMICTIVWGETDEFGNFNNSLSMNGTGIVNHDVVLPGAQQGVEYQFRVQGSTADGRQFRSELGSFTIPVTDSGDAAGAMAEVAHGDNLAQGATLVEVSSIFGTGWEAENALDGDTTTEWASADDGDEGFITIDLGSPQDVVGIEFITRRMLDGTATTEMYTITVDGDETFGPYPAGSPATPNFTELDFTGQQVRFDVDSSTGGNVGAVEVRVFAPAA